MKKKISSVLLCLTLCLPFVLASCTVPSLWPPKQEKEKTFFDDISCYWDKKVGYDSQSSFVPSGTVAKENKKFVYTTELVYSNESAGILVDKTIINVYYIYVNYIFHRQQAQNKPCRGSFPTKMRDSLCLWTKNPFYYLL